MKPLFAAYTQTRANTFCSWSSLWLVYSAGIPSDSIRTSLLYFHLNEKPTDFYHNRRAFKRQYIINTPSLNHGAHTVTAYLGKPWAMLSLNATTVMCVK